MPDSTRFSLRDGMDLAGVDIDALWWRYAGLGGSGDLASLASWATGDVACDGHEHDLIAQALNEIFMDRGQDTFPVGYARPASSPVAATAGWPVHNLLARGSRSLEARRYAASARLRSAAASRRAAVLHATAAQLMHTSGQLQFARHAEERGQDAWQRGIRSSVA
jgi:hypothetical protein